jgi:general stress protein YciG
MKTLKFGWEKTKDWIMNGTSQPKNGRAGVKDEALANEAEIKKKGGKKTGAGNRKTTQKMTKDLTLKWYSFFYKGSNSRIYISGYWRRRVMRMRKKG